MDKTIEKKKNEELKKKKNRLILAHFNLLFFDTVFGDDTQMNAITAIDISLGSGVHHVFHDFDRLLQTQLERLVCSFNVLLADLIVQEGLHEPHGTTARSVA